MHRIQLADPAKRDIQAAFTWWAENRSLPQATAWYEQIFQAISTLRQMPERCPLVPEMGLSKLGIRQLPFGIGNRPTHRIVFAIDGDMVTVLRVRHYGQDELAPPNATG